MGGQNRLSLEFQHHDHRDQHRPASSSMWIQFEGGGQVGRTWHSRLECSYSRICSGSIPRKLKTRNKQLPRTPNRDCSYASPWMDSSMAGSSGMRVLFEERGRLGRTWHSWLEFSSSVLLPTAHIYSDDDTPRMLVSHSWSMLSSHLVGDVKHVIASQTFYVSTSNHCLLSTLAYMS